MMLMCKWARPCLFIYIQIVISSPQKDIAQMSLRAVLCMYVTEKSSLAVGLDIEAITP